MKLFTIIFTILLVLAGCGSGPDSEALTVTERKRMTVDPRVGAFLIEGQRAYERGAYALALALTDLGNISERRTARLIDPACSRGLPPFLTRRGGLESGMMIAHYTAAALASENKVWAHPATADTIPTSANVEDHVSMAPTAAHHCHRVLDNVEHILAVELLCAAQGIDFRREMAGPEAQGQGTRLAYERIRARVPFLEGDEPLSGHIEALADLIRSGSLAV